MASRAADWLRQAQRDLRHAEHAFEDGDYEWACFAAQQAAEKGLKSVYQKLGGEARGHSVTRTPDRMCPTVENTDEDEG